MLVRMATPGMVCRIRSISFRKISPVRPALHALENRSAGVLQRHVDILHQRIMRGDGVEQSLRDLVGIAVEEAHPLFVLRFDIRQRLQAAAPSRP